MKYQITAVRDLRAILKDLEPHIRDPRSLRVGRDFKKMAMRPRELLGNWLFCVTLIEATGRDWTLSDDPTGGDGVMLDRTNGTGFLTEHIFLPPPHANEGRSVEQQVVDAVAKKAGNGAIYARGKTLVVFSEAVGKWFPNRAAKAIAGTHGFEGVWAAGLETADGGTYIYWVTRLEPDHAPAWRIRIHDAFDGWTVEPIQ
jgi:hypothetical protein